jgi:hypothetical protein
MKRYYGNEMVEPGLYFNLRQISFKTLDEEGHLPGTGSDEYHRLPVVAMLVVGPALGLAYAIFLPLIGFAMLAWVGIGKLAQVVGAAELARVLKPAWQPAMAFFSRGKPAAEKPAAEDGWAEDVKKELEEKDHEGAA